MSDYYVLVRRAVSALERNTEDDRRALYERVRNALAGILRASNPAPSEDEIMDECLGLEAAISRVEAPYSILRSLSNLPPDTRAALRSALDTMYQIDAPLSYSEPAERMCTNKVAKSGMPSAIQLKPLNEILAGATIPPRRKLAADNR